MSHHSFALLVAWCRRKKNLFLILLVLGAIPTGLAAQGTSQNEVLSPAALKRMSVEELLAQHVLSVSRRPESWDLAASNVFLMLGQGVRTTGATVLPELLRMAPNLFVAQKSSSEWAVNARGFVRTNAVSNKLLVMVDGRSVYSPLFSNVFWESTSFFLPDLARLEVISGPAGASWGANAVNGVINIQSKSARETVGGLVYANTGTASDSFGARYGIRLGANGAARIYVKGAQYDPTRAPDGTEDNRDPWKSIQTGMRADWGNAATGELTLQGDLFVGRYENHSDARTTSDGFNVLGRWAHNLSPDSELWIRAYSDYSRRNTQDQITEVSHTSDLEFQHSFKLGESHDLLWGGNYRFMEDSISKTVGFTILPRDLDFSLGSLFGQHEFVFYDDALKLTTGLRLEHNQFSGWEHQPSVRLAWRGAGQLVWLAGSRASRIPSRLDRGFYAPDSPPYLVAGGIDFKAEILEAYELGWRAQPMTGFALTATAYYHDYSDLRSVEPNGAAVVPYTVQNLVEGRSLGLELFADCDLTPWWRLRAGGFLMNQETWLKPGGADVESGLGEASFPEYQAQVRSTLRLGPSITWWTGLRHVAEVPAFEDGNGVVPAYTEMDMNLTWSSSNGLELSLTGRNLLDSSHPEIGGLNVRREIQRSVQTAVRYKF